MPLRGCPSVACRCSKLPRFHFLTSCNSVFELDVIFYTVEWQEVVSDHTGTELCGSWMLWRVYVAAGVWLHVLSEGTKIAICLQAEN
jgi:hypothetical protein